MPRSRHFVAKLWAQIRLDRIVADGNNFAPGMVAGMYWQCVETAPQWPSLAERLGELPTVQERPAVVVSRRSHAHKDSEMQRYKFDAAKIGIFAAALSLALASNGCLTRADNGALIGGLTGAGVGAAIGSAVGDPVAGAAIGAGVGGVGGAMIGSNLDEIEARNRAEIEARLGRPVAVGAVTTGEVIAMTQAGVNEEVIVNHIRIHGIAQPIQTQDIIQLQSSGVSTRVISALQAPPNAPMVVQGGPAPPPVIIERPYYGGPYWGPPPPYPYRHRWHGPPPGGVSWGISVSN